MSGIRTKVFTCTVDEVDEKMTELSDSTVVEISKLESVLYHSKKKTMHAFNSFSFSALSREKSAK